MEKMTARAAFAALYRQARRGNLTGVRLYAAALELTGEPSGAFRGPIASRLHGAVEKARADVTPLRLHLLRQVLNCWGHGNPYRSPPMESPRFPAWRRQVARADALRKRLQGAARLELDAGGWVVRLLPPTVDERIPTGEIGPKRSAAHERAIRRAWEARKASRVLLAAYNASGDQRRAMRRHSDDLEGQLQRERTAHEGTRELLATMHENYRALAALAGKQERKRRRSTVLARSLMLRLNAEYRLVDRYTARLRERVA